MIRSHELDTALEPHEILASLGEPVRQLVQVNHVLYGGRWEDFIEDLRRRLAGRPYLFRLAQDPDETLAWAERLHRYEQVRQEPLAGVLMEVAR